MTGFATVSGAFDGYQWVWEIRSVNGKGLDIRTRLPEGAETLEKPIKSAISKSCVRGTVNIGLRVKAQATAAAMRLNADALDVVIAAAIEAQSRAETAGLKLSPSSPAELIAQKSVLDVQWDEGQDSKWIKHAGEQLPELLTQFQAARAQEGAALETILTGQIEQVGALVSAAAATAEARQDGVAAKMKERIEKLLEATDGLDEARLEQEVAIIAVKSDVTEEIDRLGAHVTAATELLRSDAAFGRKFDFLMQEFNREANTLCSKSGSTELTRIGLDLKTLIDQMREQVQNIE